MSEDYEEVWEHPETKEWMDHVRRETAPKVLQSAFTVSLIPADPARTDVKFAVELGLSIMYDKPIIAVFAPGQQLPEHLVRVADHLVEWAPGQSADGLMAAIREVMGP